MRSSRCWVLLLLLAPATAAAQPEPSTDVPDDVVTQDTLWSLDRFRHRLREYRDNKFRYEEKMAEYVEGVNELPGAKLTWPATVNRIGIREVSLRQSQYGRTRIVLLHYTQRGEAYGNPRFAPPATLVPPSSGRYFKHNAESILEIGLQIPLELARDLSHDDLVQLTGRIERVDTRIIHGNSPDTLVYVSDIQAEKYLTEDERLLLEEE